MTRYQIFEIRQVAKCHLVVTSVKISCAASKIAKLLFLRAQRKGIKAFRTRGVRSLLTCALFLLSLSLPRHCPLERREYRRRSKSTSTHRCNPRVEVDLVVHAAALPRHSLSRKSDSPYQGGNALHRHRSESATRHGGPRRHQQRSMDSGRR